MLANKTARTPAGLLGNTVTKLEQMLDWRNVNGIMKKLVSVPANFPRDPSPTAISGYQSKLSVRLIDGEYVTGATDGERAERYAICADLVEQLAVYCERKHRERPEESVESLLLRVGAAARNKGWDVSPVEITWCLAKVKDKLLGNPSRQAGDESERYK